MTAEQKARDLLERIGVDCAQSFTAGDLTELANLIAEREGHARSGERTMTPEEALPNGYYWLFLEGEKPEVIQIYGDWLLRCGSDVVCKLEGCRWLEFGDPLDIVAIIGPLEPPDVHLRAQP